MDQMVQRRNPKNISELKGFIVDAWKDVNLNELQKSVLSWQKKRLEMCIEENGDRFEHKL